MKGFLNGKTTSMLSRVRWGPWWSPSASQNHRGVGSSMRWGSWYISVPAMVTSFIVGLFIEFSVWNTNILGIMSDHACRQANLTMQHCHLQDSILDECRSSGAPAASCKSTMNLSLSLQLQQRSWSLAWLCFVPCCTRMCFNQTVTGIHYFRLQNSSETYPVLL